MICDRNFHDPLAGPHQLARFLGKTQQVAFADPADEPQGGSAIRRCAPIERLEPVLVLDGNAAVRWDGVACEPEAPA